MIDSNKCETTKALVKACSDRNIREFANKIRSGKYDFGVAAVVDVAARDIAVDVAVDVAVDGAVVVEKDV